VIFAWLVAEHFALFEGRQSPLASQLFVSYRSGRFSYPYGRSTRNSILIPPYPVDFLLHLIALWIPYSILCIRILSVSLSLYVLYIRRGMNYSWVFVLSAKCGVDPSIQTTFGSCSPSQFCFIIRRRNCVFVESKISSSDNKENEMESTNQMLSGYGGPLRT